MYVVLFTSPIGVDLSPYVNYLKIQMMASDCVEVKTAGCYALSDDMVRQRIEAALNDKGNKGKLVIVSGALALDDAALQAKFDTTYFIKVDNETSKSLFVNGPCSEIERISPSLGRRKPSSLTVSLEEINKQADAVVRKKRENDWPTQYEPLFVAIYGAAVHQVPRAYQFDDAKPLTDAVKQSLQALADTIKCSGKITNSASCFVEADGVTVDGAVFVMDGV